MTERKDGGGALPRIAANKGRELQRAAPSGRKLFDAERKARFLEYFCGSANLSWAAREAGVNYRTVLRHRAEDPAFAEAYDLAEAQSVPRLRAWLAEAAEEERKRLTDAALGRAGEGDGDDEEEEEPGGDTAPARLSVEQAMQFLRDHEQSQARRERAARMGPGRGNGRPVSVASNEEVKEALFKALRAHGIRVRAGMGAGASDSHSAAVTVTSDSHSGEVTVTSDCHSGAGEGLRGPEHHFAWCDELAKWTRAAAAWDNLQLGLRVGERPRAMVTTTPRPLALLRSIRDDPATAIGRGRMEENLHLGEAVRAETRRRYGASRLGRQELDGELFDEIQGALWTRDLIEESRLKGAAPGGYARVVVGVDPPAGVDGDACGIVVCGLGSDGTGFVLADLSAGGLTPEGWARRVDGAARAWGAHKVVAEANNGGRMVESVLRGANVALPVKLVHASEGKSARAEPVAALFEAKRAKLAGTFPELEDELCALVLGGGYEGKGSPDRADAMVWALTELTLGERRAEPRARRL